MSEAQPSKLKVWWLTIRPATLWAGAAPVFVGGALAAQHERFAWLPAIAALLGALFIQVGCNLVNDYSDFQTGADNEDRLGPERAAQQGWLSVEQLKRGAYVSLGLALLVGLYLTWVAGWPILALGLLSLICAVAYTAGPFPLAYVGLGDLFVLLFFGFGAVGGTYYVLTQRLSASLLSWGWSVGALATAILVVNNLRDREGDEKVGKKTLAVRFGALFARLEYTLLLTSALLAPPLLEASYSALLLSPFALWLMVKVWRSDGRALNPLLGRTAQLELLFCAFAALELSLC